MNLIHYIQRQILWSTRTFGPGFNTEGLLDHIRKEIKEVESKPDDLLEWIDIIILALDGAWRRGFTPTEIASCLQQKQEINESRKWPDWRTATPGKAIEHIKEEDE